ncbi:MAG: heme ABC exporter ATP-binding protein CcmA [Desulfovibrio sp.]|jgi:heme exporter protein A|nr:heme ABC exporter ATP-binding protein CcmA [Desulfovibrio sp.]
MLLGLDNVTHFYGPRLIFRDISLSIRSGTVTLLTGANGTGKSTLLKIMAGLLLPSAGSVFRGRRTPEGKAAVGTNAAVTGENAPVFAYLGHQTFLYPDLSALENLRFWTSLYQRACAEQDFMDVLERVELAHVAEEKVKNFSRGMAQRLNLARIFLSRPDVFLLDEPDTGLDTRSRSILYREIADAKNTGSAIVWITHNPAEDIHRADMLAILEHTMLSFYGTTRDYLEQNAMSPRHMCSVSHPVHEGGMC